MKTYIRKFIQALPGAVIVCSFSI